MYMVATEAVRSHSFTLDRGTVKHAFGVSPDVLKHRTLLMEECKSASDSSPLRTPQAKADNESVRRRLRESLTSALEMVVSKQLVKSVLGLVKDVRDSGEEQKLVSPCDVEGFRCDYVSGSNEPISSDVDQMADTKASVAQTLRTKLYNQHEVAGEVNEAPAKKLKSEGRVSDLEEMKSGLQLIGQAKRVAWNVELNLFSFYGGVNKKYKEKARSLLFNLKDKSNPELRARVFNGQIATEVLVRMTGEQLASKELSQWRSAKAEEFASMVVLTDADVDPRRIVKKTHKGEFRVAVAEVDFPVSVENAASGGPLPDRMKKKFAGSGDGESAARAFEEGPVGAVEEGPADGKQSNMSPEEDVGDFVLESGTSNERLEAWSTAKYAVPNDVGKDLPAIMSLDEFIHNRDGPGGERAEPSRAGDFSEDGTLVTGPTKRNRETLLPYSPTSLSDICTPKLSESPNTGNTDLESLYGGQLSKLTRNGIGTLVWMGSIQISATRSAFIDGFYKSGEKLELKNWPQTVEVKGRVRLGELSKFLQDLQLSRSRTVTVLSLCPADGRGDAKQTQAYLKEMADQYCMGDRAGFVEPRPGFELYLVAPGRKSLEHLSEDIGLKSHSPRKNEVLVGVVVWRKSQNQGLASSRGSDQNTIVKKVALSNLASQSPHLNAKAVHWTETPSSQGTSPVFRKTSSAPSLVNVSGNWSTHSTCPQIDSSATCETAIHRDWQQSFAASRGQLLARVHTIVSKNLYDTISDSQPHQQESVELSNGPPGFMSRPMESFAQRSTPSNCGGQVGGFQAPLTGHFPRQVSMVGVGNRDITQDIPPGFLGLPSGKIPSVQDDDDDDLPEFNFDTERIVIETTPVISSPANQTQFLALNKYNIGQHSLGGLQHMGASGYSGQGFCNTRDDSRQNPVDLPPGCIELTTKHVVQGEESLLSSSPAGCIEGAGNSGDGLIRGSLQPMVMVHEFSRCILPINGSRQPGQSRVLSAESIGLEDEFREFSHDSRIQETLGPSACAPSNFLSSQPLFVGRVGQHLGDVNPSKTDMPGPCSAPAPPKQWPQPPRPTTFSTDHQPLNDNRHLSLAQLIAQTQEAVRKGNGANWLRAPESRPQQDVRHDRGHGLSMSNPHLWQHPSPAKMHSSASNRQLEQRGMTNGIIRLSGNKYGGRNWRDHSYSRERSRQRSQSPVRDSAQARQRSLSPSSREIGHARQRSRSSSPARDESRKDVGSTGGPSNAKTETKPKRERERDQ